MEDSKFKIQNLLLVFCIFTFAFFLSTACVTGSIPNLEQAECADSKILVKQFYSQHFAGEMKFSKENLKQREKFFTPDFFKSLEALQTENDVFTTDSSDLPRAFRIGSCKVIEPTKTSVEILLLWRTEVESRQQIVQAEVVKQSDKWLINKISR